MEAWQPLSTIRSGAEAVTGNFFECDFCVIDSEEGDQSQISFRVEYGEDDAHSDDYESFSLITGEAATIKSVGHSVVVVSENY